MPVALSLTKRSNSNNNYKQTQTEVRQVIKEVAEKKLSNASKATIVNRRKLFTKRKDEKG